MYVPKNNYDMYLRDPLTKNQKRYISDSSNLFGYDISKVINIVIKAFRIIYSFSTLIVLLVVSLLMYYNYKSLLPNALLLLYIFVVYTSF